MVLVCLGFVINCGWSVWGRNGREFSVLRRGTECWKFWAVSNNPRIVCRLLKQSGLIGWAEIVHVCCLQNIAYSEWLGVCVETNC